ncbi:MAG: addiction module protein [Planctomycetota bacterium]|nr:addiction module protein [Planctomycetaceae bacterium]MDQ3329156.1 addiction module protein [Planctomycetota bacterium]
MSSSAEDIEIIALQLPRDQRAHLAERLIASLDDDSEIEQAWAIEIRRRVEQIRSRGTETIDAAIVFEELRLLTGNWGK